MRIAQVAPLNESVPPRLYGGTERVVSWLTEELVRRGHAVTLFASGDSDTTAQLAAPVRRALRLDPVVSDLVSPHVVELAQVFERSAEFDVVHSHVDYLAYPFDRVSDAPILHTLHGRLDSPDLETVYRYFRDLALVSISDAQRQPLAPLDLNWVGTVHHGLPTADYAYSSAGGPYLAFLGRIAPEKRVDLAIAAAERAGVPLKIAAKIAEEDRAYFEREIEELIDSPRVEFIGEITDADKAEFLGGALALLFPIDWPEPFGLVMIEALACGTPVIARPYGSVPEVMVDGRTGYIADTLDELVDAIKRVDSIDRLECRRHVEAHFTVERMADDYEKVYRRLVAPDA